MKTPAKLGFALLVSVAFCLPTPAIIFYSTGDSSHNTNAPVGALENSGWQWQGEWSGNQAYWEYLGTPIARHYFITAKHTGGTTGWKFRYKGKIYTPVQQYEDVSSDLEIWRVAESFDSYAPLYVDSDEGGKGCVIFGRGLTRGDAVETSRLNGWEWGVRDNVMRWGTNQIIGTSSGYLISEFDGSGAEECTVADKDSGGAVFVKNSQGEWRLAGINYSIYPAQFSTNSSGSNSFYAASFDYRGLYYYTGSSWLYASGSVKKQQIYATQISPRYSWITNVIGDELDQDVDLLPDWWEMEHDGSITGMVASADDDGDGLSNVEEWTADTDPIVSNAVWLVGGSFALTNQTFTFTGSTARQYQVFYTTNDLADAGLTWTAHGSPIWGAGAGTEITVTNLDDTVFYRVWVTLP